MPRLVAALFAVAAAFGAAGFAGKPAPSLAPLGPPPPSGTALPAGQCILREDIRNHSIVDERTMLLDVFAKGTYRVTTKPACFRGSVSADPIVFRQVGRSRICKSTDLGLETRAGFCPTDSIVRLSPDEVAALPRKLKP